MKILHISTIDSGGAYNATKRLNEMMINHGIDSKILVRTKTNPDSVTESAFNNSMQETVSKIKNVINLIHKSGEVKMDVLGTDLRKHPMVMEADVIFIHWISTFLSPKQIYQISKLENKKVFFVMHDMWLFTGGCHVDRRCGGYEKNCRECPMAGKAPGRSFERKAKLIQKSDIRVTGPSHWIVKEADKSAVLAGKKAEYMPNVYNAEIFYPRKDIASIRDKYSLSQDKKLILFGAADTGTQNENKGFKYLLEALSMLDMKDKQLVVIGNSGGAKELLAGYDAQFLGFISDENKLAEIYSAADVYVNPSKQESFGYTVCEAMACGTPAVAFAVGGMLDQIEHKSNGYLVKFCDSKDLAEGIEYVLDDSDAMGNKAKTLAKRFSYDEAWESISKVLEYECK